MKKRIYFDKFDDMKYISHLDLIRFMERIFKKAHIEMKYSQGFHPRPKMSFGNPISLGTDAYNEPMDIEIEEELSSAEVLEKLKTVFVLGFRVTHVEDTGKASIPDDFESINYELYGSDNDINKLMDLFSQDEIIEEKEKKGKITTRNLKERIVNFEKVENKIKITLINMSPNSFFNLVDINVHDMKINRLGYNKRIDKGV